MTPTDESGPAADRTASKNTTDSTMVRPRSDIGRARHARAAQSPVMTAPCGCEDPRHHEGWCLAAREALHDALVNDPFRCPRWTPDEEARALARIHADVDFARRLSGWITSAGVAA